MGALVIGGCGFIGSHVVDALAAQGPVTVFDNLSTGRRENLAAAEAGGQVRFVEGDVRDKDAVRDVAQGHQLVVHLATNADPELALKHPRVDLERGTIATYEALEAARRAGAERFVFISSIDVYGAGTGARTEAQLGELPQSLYGAGALASEAMISAFCHSFELSGLILRLPDVVGPRASRGELADLWQRLAEHPKKLTLAGSSWQQRAFVHVSDCVRAVLFGLEQGPGGVQTFNVAPGDTTGVGYVAEQAIFHSPYPRTPIQFPGGRREPKSQASPLQMDTSRLQDLGFRLRHSSDAAVLRAMSELAREGNP